MAHGLHDLGRRHLSKEALLVAVASPRLRELGFAVPDLETVPMPYNHALYEALEAEDLASGHGTYNSLLARIVSFADSYDASMPLK
ncbi:hypothetical protein EON81_05355 [bacterium]|nr:MAG: hypothetical protein EON81_05355 [bacterium]